MAKFKIQQACNHPEDRFSTAFCTVSSEINMERRCARKLACHVVVLGHFSNRRFEALICQHLYMSSCGKPSCICSTF